MRIRYTEIADADLDKLLTETARQWPGSLRRTIARLRRFERTLLEFPDAGRRTRFDGIRKLSLTPLPYAAFYRAAGDEITILRIYHAARRPFDADPS